jgi:hypothetical protein
MIAVAARILLFCSRIGWFALPIYFVLGIVTGVAFAILEDVFLAVDGVPKNPFSVMSRVQQAYRGLRQSEMDALGAEAWQLIGEWDFCEDGKRQAEIDARLDEIEARMTKVYGAMPRFTAFVAPEGYVPPVEKPC